MSDKRPITIDDLWACKRVGAPALCPQGRYAVVPVVSYDMETNESQKELYRLEAGSSEARLLAQKASSPVVSPDGARLAFLRPDGDKNAQLAVMPLDGGEAQVLTELPLGVEDPKWFPDGKRIAFIAQVYRDALDVESTRKRAKEKKEDKVKAYVTENAVARFWDHYITDEKVHHIFEIDLESKEIRDLTPESAMWWDFMDASGSYDIAPDGKEIAFSAERSKPPHHKLNMDIFTVNLDTLKMENITQEEPGHEFGPKYSKDGATLGYRAQRIPEFYADKARLVFYDRASRQKTVMTEEWDRSVNAWDWTPDGKHLVLEAEDQGAHAVFRTEAKPGVPERLFHGGTITSLKQMATGDLACLWDDFSHPAELFVLSEDGRQKTPWTTFNTGNQQTWDLGAVHNKTVKGAGGRDIQYYEILPPGFTPDKKWPLVILVHGGPHGIWSDNFHYRWNPHLFASKGYVVVAPNPHGSTSWGQDFADSIQGGWGDKPYTDCMAVIDAMEATGYVDPERMGAAGGSYGGYMMAWMAGHTDRFACIINHAGCSNTLSMYASDITDDWDRSMGGSAWDNIQAIDAMNPLRFADGFKTPMLVIHGEMDYRVPVTQGLEIYHVYKHKGLDARLLVYPDENHWILKPQNARLWYKEVHAWLERYLQK